MTRNDTVLFVIVFAIEDSCNKSILYYSGSCEDKMRLLFTMYDVDKSGTLSKKEVTQMIT